MELCDGCVYQTVPLRYAPCDKEMGADKCDNHVTAKEHIPFLKESIVEQTKLKLDIQAQLSESLAREKRMNVALRKIIAGIHNMKLLGGGEVLICPVCGGSHKYREPEDHNQVKDEDQGVMVPCPVEEVECE